MLTEVSTYSRRGVAVSKGTKRAVGVVVGVLLLYLVITQPQQSAGMVQDLLGLLQDGADSLTTFLRSLFA